MAAGIITGQHAILHWKYHWCKDMLDDNLKGSAFAVYCAIGVGCILIAATLTSLLEPLSGGSGIPDVKSYLNGDGNDRHLEIAYVMSVTTAHCRSLLLSLLIACSHCLSLLL